MKNTVWIMALVALMFSCEEGSGPDGNQADQTGLLTNLADNIVVPAYDNAVDAASGLVVAAQDFAAAPDQALLDDLRDAFAAMYLAWQDIGLFEFGPADNVTLRSNVNTYPANTANIQSLIAAGTFNLDAIANISSKGLPALDYLLHGAAATDPGLIGLYTTDPDAGAYKDFLVAVAQDIEERITAVRDEWTGGYAAAFKSNTGSNIGSSLGMFMNAYILHYERFFRTLKLGLPAGVFSLGDDIFPEEAEALYSGMSTALIHRNFDALERFYRGTGHETLLDGAGIDDYLQDLGANAVNAEITAQWEVIDAKLDDLETPLTEQLASDRPTVLAVYTEVQRMVPVLKADLASALSIQITYADNDGD